jgi:hypothetical protein
MWRRPALEAFEERVLLAADGPVLLAVIPSPATLIEEGTTLRVAPRELLVRFDSAIDPASLVTSNVASIQFTRGGDHVLGNGNDVTVTPNFIGIDSNPFDVIVRFAENLPDDLYQITIVGAGSNPLRDTTGKAFNNSQDLNRKFQLDLGAQVVSVVPQPVTRDATTGKLSQSVNTIDVYFNANDPLDMESAESEEFYQLFRTMVTASPQDDQMFNPTSVSYSPATGKAVLTFDTSVLITAGTYRLRIGNNDPLSLVPQTPTVGTAGSSLGTAANLGSVFTATQGTQSLNVSGTIGGSPVRVLYPGGPGEPGTRDIPVENHLSGTADTSGVIPVIEYNFQGEIGTVLGAPAFNSITENQKQRAREVFSYYAHFLGVEFVETASAGLTIATGDPRAVDANIPPGGIGGIAGGGRAVMNAGVNWGDSEPRGAYFITAMHEIGHLLGLGHTYELPPLTVQGSAETPGDVTNAEGVFPGDNDILLAQYLHPPVGNDVRMYRFTLDRAGSLNLETFAERLQSFDPLLQPSQLNSVITVFNSTGTLLARNDDYYGNDSFLQLQLATGTYFVAVTSTGNTKFDPAIANTGFGGTTQGSYQLRLTFTPSVDASNSIVDQTGTLLDGDLDGVAGGVNNFWFETDTARTIFVDKVATAGSGTLGSITNPYTTISSALAAATPGSIVRIVGNGGADGLLGTLADNVSYNVGFNSLNQALSDGSTFNVPRDVTVMIDAGAVIKLRGANVDIGTSAQGVNRAGGALQVLGTTAKDTQGRDIGSVYFTSYYNNAIGTDPGTAKGPLAKGNWGGLVFRNDSDLESAGIFLNYVNHAQLSYGGGQISVNSVLEIFDQIHLETARPNISFNTITNSAHAAISADPNSYEESQFQTRTFAADYTRTGPKVYGNALSGNSVNALFVRIRTEAGANLDPLTVPARFNDTDIVHVIEENLEINGQPGGYSVNASGLLTARPSARLAIDPGVVVKMGGARIETKIGAQFIAEGTSERPVVFTSVFDDRYGRSGTSDTTNDGDSTTPEEGDWGGLFFGPLSIGSVDRALITFAGGSTTIEGGFARFNAVEIHQADVRLANSTLERNAAGGESSNRAGRGSSTPAVIFIRGAQPVIVNNIIQNNDTQPQTGGPRKNTAAISINVNALNAKFVTDSGRSRGLAQVQVTALTNSGPLIRGNLIDNTPINGMIVRGGVVTTDVVMDDTDIVHVLLDEIVADTQFSLSGRVRLESTSTDSLVVKLLGATAGITATGVPLDIDDRSGGAVQIVGMGNRPVIMTSLFDGTVGAGFTPGGEFQTDTYNLQGESFQPEPGDWRSIKLDDFSNDRNVEVVNEIERGFAPSGDTNRLPTTAQFLGNLAKDLKGGDDVLRLGYEIHGAISQTVLGSNGGDVDVYSFRGTAGSVVWFDIDRTTQALDTVVELIDANGAVVARSNNSIDEQTNTTLLVGSAQAMQPGFSGVAGPFTNPDYFTTNPMDAGMRVILPGTAGSLNTYFVRVRASSTNLSTLSGGLSQGRYTLQMRLQNLDEFPGSIVRYADIRYAAVGVDVIGKPAHSPLLGDTASSSIPHNTFETAQDIGNLLTSDRNEISVAGNLATATDVVWFKMDLNYDLVQSIGGASNALKTFAAMFNVQYTDGLARPDTTISVFDQSGNLLLIGRDSQVPDAQPRPTVGADSANLSHGSFGVLDATIGTVQLPAGLPQPGTGPSPVGSTGVQTYYIAVSSGVNLPTILDATFQMTATNPLVRLEPINSVDRIVDDRIGSTGTTTALGSQQIFPGATPQELNLSAVPFTLDDVVLYVHTLDDIFTVNPFTGRIQTFITDPRVVNEFLANAAPNSDIGYLDIAMRDDGRFYTFARGFGDNNTPGTNGSYTQFAPGDAHSMDVRSNPIQTFQVNPNDPVNMDTGLFNFVPADPNVGVQVNAMAFSSDSFFTFDNAFSSSHVDGRMLFVVGNRAPGNLITQSQNLLFRLDPNTGAPFNFDLITNEDFFPPPEDVTFTVYQPFANNSKLGGSGTVVVPRGTLSTGVYLLSADGSSISDGTTFSLRPNSPITFEMDIGNGVSPGRTAVLYNTTDTASMVASKIAGAISGAGVGGASASGNNVRLNTTLFISAGFPFRTDSLFGTAPNITGLAILPSSIGQANPRMFAVSSGGGLYEITNYHSIDNAQMTLLNIVNAPLSGLTAGPPHVEGGRYRETLFAVGTDGDLLAFTTTGAPDPVFANGQARIASDYTSDLSLFFEVFAFQGLAFSTLDYNLWHVTPTRGGDAPTDLGQHGVMSSFDNDIDRFSVDIPTGGSSFHFGLEDPRFTGGTNSGFAQPGSQNYIPRNQTEDSRQLSGNLSLFSSYNLPGGAYGSLQTATFSLEGSSAADKPTLYFNYALDTQNANSKQTDMRDSFRVYGSADGFTWIELATNNSARSALFSTDAELPTYLSDSGGVYRGDKSNQAVQEAFDVPGIPSTNPRGYVRNDFDEDLPTTAVGWRQARVDLGDFAGQSNIRLRFDFSTAGSMNEGLQGDQFGHFNTPYRTETSILPSGEVVVFLIIESLAARDRNLNNNHEGVYIDDLIVGFAGRGEMVTGHFDTRVAILGGGDPPPGVNTFTPMPVNPDFTDPQRINTGLFQLDVRRGTEYAESLGGNLPFITLFDTFNINDRFSQGFTLVAPAATQLANGQTFAINTIYGTVTFEFRFTGSAAPGNVAVSLNSADSALTVARKIRDAINTVAPSANFDVKAGVKPNGTRVDVFGGIDVAPGPLQLIVFDNLGDTVPSRTQGQTILQGNRISHTQDAGIVVRPVADLETGVIGLPGHTGSVAQLAALNTQQLVPGVTIKENLIFQGGQVGILISGSPTTDIAHAVPFVRIVNNTVAQTPVGIQVINNASPTILNNIVAETGTAISVDATSTTTVVGASVYQSNTANLVGVSETNPIFLAAGAPLFVDSSKGNFYLAAGAKAIDSSVNSVQERPALQAVTSPLGVTPSPIRASDYDLLGQLRVDDPSVDSPPGLGSNVFKDRGALERADFTGPTAVLAGPVDNDTSGIDRNPATNQLLLLNQQLTDFVIQLVDASGVGIDDATVDITKFTIERTIGDTTTTLVPNFDYSLSYDTNNKFARFIPAQGIWINGIYTITLDNGADGIKDVAGNVLQANVPPDTRFVIELTDSIVSPWQNPANKFDVNADGRVSTSDLLVVINRILAGQLGPLPQVATVPPYIDVSGDGALSTVDALQLINFIITNPAPAAAPLVTTTTTLDSDLPAAPAAAPDANPLAFAAAMSEPASYAEPEYDAWWEAESPPAGAAPSAAGPSALMVGQKSHSALAATMEPDELEFLDTDLDNILADLTDDAEKPVLA